MKKRIIFLIIFLIFLIILSIFLYFYFQKNPRTYGEYDSFVLCLKEKGVVLYGAFWSKYTNEQKEMFKKSAKLLPYVECSTRDKKGQKQICLEKEIDAYPYWVFQDGSVLRGKLSFSQLSEKTGCPLPE
ncbi:MAG TPA: hypothetical protein PLE40_00865 [Candidatus Pacearchaeota archaeon]|nr:hypothetical protein [Candidatus Pacearchaeota archaeon]HOL90182.1 hypothetical protein [Candidatus Pacearchaeota archaeon]HPO68283.1 hypothetical protein [Candidatus Pacearchaeota archaeon]